MKKFRIVMVALLMLISSVTLCACGDEMKIKSLVNEFEESCNQLDADGILECLNPKIADTIDKALSILDIFTEVDKDEIFSKVSEILMSGLGEVGGTELFSSIDIEIEEMEVGKASATVTGTMTYEVKGEEKETPVTFFCEYSDSIEKWYISEISFK